MMLDLIVGQLAGHGVLLAIGLSPDTGPAGEAGVGGELVGELMGELVGELVGDGLVGDGLAGDGLAGDGLAGDGLAGDGLAGDDGGGLRNTGGRDTLLLGVLLGLVGGALAWVDDCVPGPELA